MTRVLRRLRDGVARRLGPNIEQEMAPVDAARWVPAARAAGWEPDRPERRLLRLLDRLAGDPADPERQLLVVGDDAGQRLGSLVVPGRFLRADAGPRRLRQRLADRRWQVIVLDVADPELRRRLAIPLSLALAKGGVLVVGRVRTGVTSPEQSTLRHLARLIDRGVGEQPPADVRRQDVAHLRAAWREVELIGNTLVIHHDLHTYVRLDDRATERWLDRRPDRGAEVVRRPAARFESRSVLRESDSSRAGSWRRRFAAPPARLREYLEVTCRPGGVLLSDPVILPESFRRPTRPRSQNRFAPTIADLAARPRPHPTGEPAPPSVEELDEPHFYWDSEFRGHFGHVLTEMLSRMWAWEEARARHPGLRILMATSSNKERDLTAHERALLRTFGVGEDRITFCYRPVRVRTLLAATPMFAQPGYLHPEITDLWDRVGVALAARGPAAGGPTTGGPTTGGPTTGELAIGRAPRRIFVSRRTRLRACENAAEVEALFVGHGFEVVHPEEHPFEAQVELFRRAEVIAGYAGSGLFTLMFAETPKHLILICPETYTAQNEWFIASVRGHRVDVAWCAARATGERDFHATYRVDWTREGRFLRQVLAEVSR
ncbi:MAG: glycosyltransferase family 61 protein [Nocardioides sp.]|uniref:glycosyltransferase 61 family protein n=1 Tax=Nocardioides sp. TaxID=35761 RepID=UPI0039E592DA